MAIAVDTKNNGHGELPPEETQEQIDAAAALLSLEELADGDIVSVTKEQLSLFQKMLTTATEKYREETIWRMGSFLDEDEAHNHVAAYYEAKELGMSTSFNVAYMFALCSANRKGNFANNLISLLTSTMKESKFPQQKGKHEQYSSTNPRSPLAER